jgi:hypothetical protein
VYAFGSKSTLASTATVPATAHDGSTVNLAIGGNINSFQMSNVTVATNQTAATTTISFTVTGESGTIGFGNITVPKSSVLYGPTPTIYIDGQSASNQGYMQDATNYYVWYTTHFSQHQISIVFTQSFSSGSAAQSSLLQIIYGIAIALAVIVTVVVVLMLIIKGQKNKN